jgi:hypothetical protein
MTFRGEAEGWSAKLMAAVMGVFFRGATQKALQQDLDDIKNVLESA